MKKIFIFFLIFSFAAMFCACDKKSAATSANVEIDAVAPKNDIVFDIALNYFVNFPDDYNEISAVDFMKRISSGNDIYIIDVRPQGDYENGHITGAVSMPFDGMNISEHLASIPDDKPVYVYCDTGQNASQVTAILHMAGRNSKNVRGGFTNGIKQIPDYLDKISTDATPIGEARYEVYPDNIGAAAFYYFDFKESLTGSEFENYSIKAADAKKLLDSNAKDTIALSVRSEQDYKSGHIAESTSTPFGEDMQMELIALPKDKRIIVYSNSGQYSSQVVTVLRFMGYTAFSLRDGLGDEKATDSWIGLGYPLESR